VIGKKPGLTGTTDKYRRDLGTLGIAILAVNGLVGAGIFGLPEVLHQAVGAFAPWLLLIGGLLVMSIGVCFAELTKTTDRSGGPQRFVADAWGPYPGFMVGWSFFAARVISFGANVLVLIAYAAALWPAIGEGIVKTMVIVGIFGGLAFINVIGVRRTVGTLGALTILKLLPLILLLVVGIGAASAPGPVVLPKLSAIEGIALAALYAFVGFENATVPAGETRDPRRAMPRALLLSLALVSLIYFGLQWAYSHSAIAGSGPDAPITALARLYWGDIGATLIAATIVVSVLANLIAAYTSSSRLPSAFADDGLIPAWFGRVSRWGTPANSILFLFVLITLFALVDDFLVLAVMSSVARLIAYIASILSLPKLRHQAGHKAINVTIAIAAPIAMTLSIWATTQTNPAQWLTLGAFAVVGTILYFVARLAE
jgi:amino acid transporter